jgi:hypothetical protein
LLIFIPSPFQVHHEKELEHLKRLMDRKEEELLKNQAQERKALPKRIRQEMKAREMMFRESMRISTSNLQEIMKPTEEKDRLKKVSLRTKSFAVSILRETWSMLYALCSLLRLLT